MRSASRPLARADRRSLPAFHEVGVIMIECTCITCGAMLLGRTAEECRGKEREHVCANNANNKERSSRASLPFGRTHALAKQLVEQNHLLRSLIKEAMEHLRTSRAVTTELLQDLRHYRHD